ncbi:MAG: PEP-CTERM sorting domain-containing protein [Phycisphaerales bacterium]|nr:MAG: PEP-CTERM sorting domain-containing protein [Phycisphaerales bacterium]
MFHITVTTRDGERHIETLMSDGHENYWGFVAPAGIESVEILDLPNDGIGMASWFDNVSHGEIVPEPATLSLLALGGLAMIRKRRY